MVVAATFYSSPRFSTYTSTIVMRMGAVCVCSWTIHDPFVYVQLIQLLYTFLRIRFYIYVLYTCSIHAPYIHPIYILYIHSIYTFYIYIFLSIYVAALHISPTPTLLTLSISTNNSIKTTPYTYLYLPYSPTKPTLSPYNLLLLNTPSTYR